jgi:hypothetical protein
MATIYAANLPALQKFLDARARGASREVLRELRIAAMPGAPRGAAQVALASKESSVMEYPGLRIVAATDDKARHALERAWAAATLTD